MSQFMVMIHESEAAEAALGPAETRTLLEARAAYEQDLRVAAALCDGERLRPSIEGRRVRRRDGQLQIDQGPFGSCDRHALTYDRISRAEVTRMPRHPRQPHPVPRSQVQPAPLAIDPPKLPQHRGGLVRYDSVATSGQNRGMNGLNPGHWPAC